MTCQSCVQLVRLQLESLGKDKVKDVKVDLKTGKITLQRDEREINLEKIHQVIHETGFVFLDTSSLPSSIPSIPKAVSPSIPTKDSPTFSAPSKSVTSPLIRLVKTPECKSMTPSLEGNQNTFTCSASKTCTPSTLPSSQLLYSLSPSQIPMETFLLEGESSPNDIPLTPLSQTSHSYSVSHALLSPPPVSPLPRLRPIPSSLPFKSHITSHVSLSIKGMTCSSCVSIIEKSLLKLKGQGIFSVQVSLLSERSEVEYDPSLFSPSSIASLITSLGYEAKVLIPSSNDICRVDLKIFGMTCSSCSGLIEKTLSSVPGVLTANVNLPFEVGSFRFNSSLIGPRDIVEAIENLGFK